MKTESVTAMNTHTPPPEKLSKHEGGKVLFALFGLLFLGVSMQAKAQTLPQQPDLTFTAGVVSSAQLVEATGGVPPYFYYIGTPDNRPNSVIPYNQTIWSWNGNNRTLTSKAAIATSDSGRYILTAEDDESSDATTTFSITVLPPLVQFPNTANPGNQAVLTTTASTITLGNAQGGTAPLAYAFSVDGTAVTGGNEVLAGMTYTAISGSTAATISGTPTALNAGVDVTYIVTDAGTQSATFGFTLSVVDKPTFPANFAATYTQNYPNYNSRDALSGDGDALTLPAATGGTPTYTATNNLPNGLSVADLSDGRQVISGSPTQSGAFSYRRIATDANGAGTFTLTVQVANELRFANSANPGNQTFLIGDVESITLGNASGGQATVNYTLTAAGVAITGGNAVVAGMNYTAASGNTPASISGTPTAAANVAVAYIATDANGVSVTFQFNLLVWPKPTFATQQTDLEFTAGHARTFTLATASGGSGALAYTLARQSGNLRTQALAFASSRVLRSTAALATGDAGDYILTATDTNNIKAHTTFSIVIANQLRFASGANPGNRGVLTTAAASVTLGDAQGGKATVAYVFSVDGTTRSSGYAVVAGMAYTARSGGTAATISGTPTALNSGVDVTYIATDGNNASVTFGFTLSVVDKPTFPANFAATYTRNHPIYGSRDAISTSGDALTLPAATGGSGTPNYSVLDNSLPNGLSVRDLSDGRQVISGSPTQAGAFSYTRTATDANGVGTFVLTLHIAAEPSFGASQSRVHFTASTPREVNLIIASGGVGDLVYSIGNLPAGLTLNTTSAELGAIASIAASHAGRYTLTATDTLGATAAASFDIQIAGELGIDVTGGMIDDLTFIVGAALQLPAADGGYNPAYSVTGLGAGLTFDANRRAIDGALNIATAADLELSPTYTIADDNGASTSDAFTLHITPLRFAGAQRVLRLRPGQAQSYNLADELSVAAGSGTVVYDIDPNPSDLDGLSYADNSNDPTLTADTEFVVDDNAVLTYTLTATYTVGSATRTATQSIVLDVRQGGEQLAPVNEEVISKVAATVIGGTLSAITERLATANIATPLASIGGQTPQTALASYAKAVADDTVDTVALNNSRFVLPFASLPSNANIGAMWGSIQMREIDGDVDAVDWSGDVSGLHLGVDFKVDENLIGVAVSKNDADIDYKTTNAQGNLSEGKYEVSLTALHPYINRQFGDIDAWASIGLGSGEMTVTEEGGDAIKSDLALTAIGGGVGMQIEPGVQLRIEVQTADIDIEGNAAFDLAAQDLSTNSIRAMARWQNIYLTPTMPLFAANQTAFFEAGMRRDSGDGESRRAAMEAALGWNYRGQRATIEAAMHGLFGRKDYREWGAYTNVRVSGGDDGQGLSLRIRPSYGESQSEFGRVWNADSFDDIGIAAGDGVDNYALRTETRLSYGIQSASGLVAPFVDAVTSGNANDIYRLGVDWSPHRYFDVNLTGERRIHVDEADEQRILLQGAVKF